MNCKRCEGRLAALVDGELAPGERAAVCRHLAECSRCAALHVELRVIDGLLLRPQGVRLEGDFTRATMAEVRGLPSPTTPRTPIAALIVCYLVASWLLLAAALLLAPLALGAAASAALHAARTIVDALGGVGRLLGRVAGWSLLADALLLLALVATVGRARPRIVERLRW